MMQTRSAKQVDLTTLTVRPVRGAAEQAEWDRLMDQHHYLGLKPPQTSASEHGTPPTQHATAPSGQPSPLPGMITLPQQVTLGLPCGSCPAIEKQSEYVV